MKQKRETTRKPTRNGTVARTANPAAQAGKTDATALSRRALLGHVRNGTIALGVLGLGAWSFSRTYAKQAELLDLAAIGNGIPTIVQVHDLQCATCQELQKRTLRAAKGFSEVELQVRVANIHSAEGGAIANRYGVPHVTLLFFDGQGEMRQVLTGLQEVDHLRDQFGAHVKRVAERS